MREFGHWGFHEIVRGRKQTVVAASEDFDIEFLPHNWNDYYTYSYLNVGLECIHNLRSVQYTALRSFNSFVQSAVNARRQGDENPYSSVLAETMKLWAKN